jgi:hypothetical protein
MSTIELQQIINGYVSHITDKSFLSALKTIIETKIAEDVYILQDAEKERVQIGREELREHKTISHNDLQKEVDAWFLTK